jgi:group I intron endonuclease
MKIYIIKNNINDDCYIGMTTKNITLRWSQHKANARANKQFLLYKAIRKYGEDKFTIDLLEECNVTTIEELGLKEVEWINKLNPRYNMTPGGEGHPGVVMTGESNPMFNKKHRQESIEKMKINRKGKGARAGELNPRYGKPGTFTGKSHTEESLAKMRKPKSVPRQRVVCELCGKEVSVNTIGQHKKAYHCE